MALYGLFLLFGILGVFAEFTSLGKRSSASEDPPIPLNYQTSTSENDLKQILHINDINLTNSKGVWGTLLLSFSFFRNMRMLFFSFKQPNRFRNVAYGLLVLGFAWVSLSTTTYAAILMFPKNMMTIKTQIFQPSFFLTYFGSQYGVNLMFFAFGMLTAACLIRYDAFFFIIQAKKSSKEHLSDDEDEGQNRQEGLRHFTYPTYALRKFVRLFMPVLLTCLMLVYILPFFGSGPGFFEAYYYNFFLACQNGWPYNLTMFQNWMYFSTEYSNSCDTSLNFDF